MTSADDPPYAEHGGEQTYPPPLELTGVRFYSFLFEADAGALRALCDERLNRPAGGGVEYHPLVPRVLFACADIGRAQCQNPPHRERGWMREIDVAFWVPVVAVRRYAGVAFAERVAWFLPYVFVDNGIAVASGREAYGFPKALGQFNIPKSHDDPARFTVDTFGVECFGPEPSEARLLRLLELRRVDDHVVGGVAHEWAVVEEAFADFVRLFVGGDGSVTLPGLGVMLQLLEFPLYEEVPLVFLKQFRDAARGDRACYQAVVEAPARLLTYRSGGHLPGTYALTVNPCATYPIVRDLGLKGPRQEALGAWYTEFDFVMGAGTEVWRAAHP